MKALLSLDRIREEGEALLEALSREHYLTGAGLKTEAVLRPIYERHAGILSDDALALVLQELRGAPPGSDARRRTRALAEWLIEEHASRALAELDERLISWEASAVVRLPDGRALGYQEAPIAIANEPDRAERERLDAARARLVAAEHAPMRLERLQRERELVEALGIAEGYVSTFEALSGVPMAGLAAQCERLLADTQAMWDEVLGRALLRELGVRPGEATRADALALFRARRFDAAFPASTLESSVRRQMDEMRLDWTAGGRILLDTREREGKRSRAFCAPVRIPDEVYLVMRPHGGQADWSTFLHELGHALHFAYMRRDLGFEERWLGDNGVTEAYAMLFDHRMLDRRWLLRYSELGSAVDDFLRASALEELHFLRRYCAKLLYERELYETGAWGALPARYAERLTAATTFRYREEDAFVDVDPRFYSTRYLRAWQLQAVINETLRDRFDEDWWRNPAAGPWVARELFGEGQREMAEELARRVSGRELGFDPLIRQVEGILS